MVNQKLISTRTVCAKSSVLLACMMGVLAPTAAQAACNTLFEATVVSGGVSTVVCRDTIQGFYEIAIRDINNTIPGSANNPAAVSNIRFLGVDAQLSYTAGSNVLVFSIPALGLNNLTFEGATRQDSGILLREYLLNNPQILGELQKQQAAVSPLSPITGTGGVLSQAIFNDFGSSFLDTPTRIATSPNSAAQGSQSVLGVGVLVSSHNVAGAKVNTISVPLSYTVRNDIDPRRQALVRGGLGLVDTAGSRSYQGRLSTGYRFPMSDSWVLTPMAGFSFSASRDVGYAVGIGNASVASTYTWEFENFDVTMGNMVGYYQTFKIPVKYSADPKIRVAALVNGLFVSQPVSFGSGKMSVEYGFSDTRLGGTKLYQNNSQELTISLGTNKSALSARSFLRGTFAVQRAKDSKGVSLGVNYWF
jgi:Autotransporter beta-domain